MSHPCAIFCGYSVAALKGGPSDLKFTFISSVLSSKGQQVFSRTGNEEGTTLCHTCFMKLEPGCRALSASMAGLLNDIIFDHEKDVENNLTQPENNKSVDEILRAEKDLRAITWEDMQCHESIVS